MPRPSIRCIALLLVLTGSLTSDSQAQLAVSGRGASVRVGGLVQALYSVSSIDAAVDDFVVRRARLRMDATASDFLRGRVVTEFGETGEGVVLDADVTLIFSDALMVSVGQFKRAFDLFHLPNPGDPPEIERDGRIEGYSVCRGVGSVCSYSRLTEALEFAGRDRGVRVEGASGRVRYAASLTNGTGLNTADENDTKSASGRVGFSPREGVVVSGQVALHDYVDPDGNASAWAFGGDVEIGTWRDGWHARAALVVGDNWRVLDPVSLDPRTFLTFQGVVTRYYSMDGARIVGVEPLVRIGYADPETGTEDDGGSLVTPGLTLYILGRNRVGANLDVYKPQGRDAEFSFKLQTTLYF